MLGIKFLIYLLTLAWLFNFSASAQALQINIHGITMSCRAFDGAPVPLSISEKALAFGGGYAQVDQMNNKSIMLSRSKLESLPKIGAFFIFYHECGHLALPLEVGLGTNYSEINADCFAIESMTKQGLIRTWKDFSDAMNFLQGATGDLGHGYLPGPERIQVASKCTIFAGGKIENVTTGGERATKEPEKLFSINSTDDCENIKIALKGGKKFIEEAAYTNSNFLEGSCQKSVEKNTIVCKRKFNSVGEKNDFIASFRKTIESCLPMFTSRLDGFFGDTWSNNADNQHLSINYKQQFTNLESSLSIRLAD